MSGHIISGKKKETFGSPHYFKKLTNKQVVSPQLEAGEYVNQIGGCFVLFAHSQYLFYFI